MVMYRSEPKRKEISLLIIVRAAVRSCDKAEDRTDVVTWGLKRRNRRRTDRPNPNNPEKTEAAVVVVM
jgi:hypothetical protein